MGAVLLQEGEIHPRTKKPTQHPIAYYSATFTPTERNYDIYEQELLAVLKALQHWRPHDTGRIVRTPRGRRIHKRRAELVVEVQ